MDLIPEIIHKEIDSDLVDMINNCVKEEKKFNVSGMYSDDAIEWQSGDVVLHETYGRGVVVGVDKMLVTVAFNSKIGIKQLMKNHKSLKKVTGGR